MKSSLRLSFSFKNHSRRTVAGGGRRGETKNSSKRREEQHCFVCSSCTWVTCKADMQNGAAFSVFSRRFSRMRSATVSQRVKSVRQVSRTRMLNAEWVVLHFFVFFCFFSSLECLQLFFLLLLLPPYLLADFFFRLFPLFVSLLPFFPLSLPSPLCVRFDFVLFIFAAIVSAHSQLGLVEPRFLGITAHLQLDLFLLSVGCPALFFSQLSLFVLSLGCLCTSSPFLVLSSLPVVSVYFIIFLSLGCLYLVFRFLYPFFLSPSLSVVSAYFQWGGFQQRRTPDWSTKAADCVVLPRCVYIKSYHFCCCLDYFLLRSDNLLPHVSGA